MKKTQSLDHVSLDFVRYANVWEDAAVLLKGLEAKPDQRHLSVCSAGDNAFALLSTDPEMVVAVDVNPAQLHLTRLKIQAIRNLDHAELLGFLGFSEQKNRLSIFSKIKNEMPRDARFFWENRTEDIELGIIHQGKFERYFQLFSNRILPFIHSKDTVNALFEAKNEAEQAGFYAKKWNNRRWQWLFKLFFSRRIMGWLGRDPAFLEQVELRVSKFIYDRAAMHLGSSLAQQNPMLRYSLKGHFDGLLPFYLQQENLEKVKQNLDRLHCTEGYVQQAGKRFGQFDGMNLSNIFEYMDAATFESTVTDLVELGNAGCRFAYWNLMVRREMSEVDERLKNLENQAKELAKQDFGFFYSGFQLDEKR